MATIIYDHTGEAAAEINGMKKLLKAAARRKKLITNKNGIPEYVVSFNWLVDMINDAERKGKKNGRLNDSDDIH